MPELLVVHEFAARAMAHLRNSSGMPCTIMFQSKYFPKSRMSSELGYLQVKSQAKSYLEEVFSIPLPFLPPPLCFFLFWLLLRYTTLSIPDNKVLNAVSDEYS